MLQKKCKKCQDVDVFGKFQYCGICKPIRLREEHRQTEIKRRQREDVKQFQREYAKAYRKKYPERIDAANKKNYAKYGAYQKLGLTVADVKQIAEKQNNACAICTSVTALHLDHDHKRKTIRGLLCGNCNRGLGLFKESLWLFWFAGDYLQKYKTWHDLWEDHEELKAEIAAKKFKKSKERGITNAVPK